jgi:hypothetical protein
VLKGLGETLGEEEFRVGSGDVETSVELLIGGSNVLDLADVDRCTDDVSPCFGLVNVSVGLEQFIWDVGKCVDDFLTCVEKLEDTTDAQMRAAATTKASEAVLLLKSEYVIDLQSGTKKLAQAMKDAADGLGRKAAPGVEKALSTVSEGVDNLMAQVLPPTLAFAREVRTKTSQEVAKGLGAVRKSLPDLAQKCKLTAERGAGAAGSALEKAAESVKAKLPELKAEAERRGRQGAKVAIEKTDALVKTVPKLANACRSKFGNKEAATAVNNAIVIGSAVATGATVMTENAPQKKDDAMLLRLHSAPSDWKVAVAAFDEGLWEEFGRAAGRAFRATPR